MQKQNINSRERPVAAEIVLQETPANAAHTAQAISHGEKICPICKSNRAQHFVDYGIVICKKIDWKESYDKELINYWIGGI